MTFDGTTYRLSAVGEKGVGLPVLEEMEDQ